jgi:hypothetical protein
MKLLFSNKKGKKGKKEKKSQTERRYTENILLKRTKPGILVHIFNPGYSGG